MKTRIIGILLFHAIIIYAVSSKTGIKNFIDPATLLFIIIAAGGLTLMKYRKGCDIFELLTSLKRYLILAGVIAGIIGFIIIVLNVDNWNAIGPAVGITLLSILYALMLYCVVDTFIEKNPARLSS